MMATPEFDLPGKEIKERKLLKGRRILITGGASGTGLATATKIHELGGEVIIGTRSREHFGEIVERLRRKRIYPFIADLTNEAQVKEEIRRLVAENHLPTDFIHSAAGGMEAFLKEIALDFARLPRIKDPKERETKIAFLREKIEKEVEESQPSAKAINFDGSRVLMEEMFGILPKGARVIYYSSLWSSLYGQIKVPCFYEGIASTKNMMEKWIIQNSGRFVAREVYPAIISGHIIRNSDVGRVINSFVLSLLPENEQEVTRQSAISMADMVRATIEVLESDPRQWPEYPRRLWVYGQDGQAKITENLPSDAPVFQMEFPL